MEEQKKLDVDISKLVPVEPKNSVEYDFKPLNKKQVKIDALEVVETTTGFENGVRIVLPKPRKQLLVKSENLAALLNQDPSKVDIRVHEWFNLIDLKDGSIGWSQHEKGKLHLFLVDCNVKTPAELVGKTVMVKVETKTDTDGTSNSKLRFLY